MGNGEKNGSNGMNNGQIRYRYMKSIGKCTKCGKEPAIEGSTMCVECNYRDSVWRKIRYDKMSDEKKKRKNQSARERRKRFQEQGLCSCGKKLTDKRYKLCAECRIYYNRKQRQYRPPKMWMELGLCRWCGEETAEGTVYCEKHLAQVREQFEKNVRPNGVNIADNSYFRRLNNVFWEERTDNKV